MRKEPFICKDLRLSLSLSLSLSLPAPTRVYIQGVKKKRGGKGSGERPGRWGRRERPGDGPGRPQDAPVRAFKPQDRSNASTPPGAENGPAGLRGPKGVDRGKAAEEPGGEPARRGEPPLRMPLCGPRTPPCGLSSPQHPFGIRREAENGPSGLWEPKGGRPQEARRPRKTQKQTPPAAGGKPPLRMPLGGPWNPGEPFSGPGSPPRTVGPRKGLEKASGADTGETGETGSGPDRRSGRRPGARRPRKGQGGGRREG